MARDYKKEYSEKLRDPRWQKKKNGILDRDNYSCQDCGSTTKTLHVHHLDYWPNSEPWECPDSYLITLCHGCHSAIEAIKRQVESDMVNSLRLILQDRFLMRCAQQLFVRMDYMRQAIPLLWQVGENESLKLLSELAAKETARLFSSEIDFKKCPACNGEFEKFLKYQQEVCRICGYTKPIKPIPNGEERRSLV